jgi:hypothetical protein
MELDAYRDALDFRYQFGLTSEPLRIDCVVIRKAEGVEIKKNIAAVFRGWNIFEYKNPGGYVSVADFYQVYAYACLCASDRKIPVTDMTISFVESRYPRKLLKHLRRERGYTHGCGKRPGDLYCQRRHNAEGNLGPVGPRCGLPIQVIESRKLPAEENVWLKNLRGGLNHTEIGRIGAGMARKDKDGRVAAYRELLLQVNAKTIQEAIEMGKSLTLEQVMINTGLAAKLEARGEARGITEIARNLKKMGLSVSQIADGTGLSPAAIEKL